MRYLYLVSSSASREYVADSLESLALPRGAVHHHRYRRKHLDPDLAGEIPNSPGQLPNELAGIGVLAIFLPVNRDPAASWASAENYLPLRCGTLVDAFLDGDVAHFFFLAGNYLNYWDQSGSRGPHRTVHPAITRYYQTRPEEEPRRYAFLHNEYQRGAGPSYDSRSFQRFVENAYYPGEWRTLSSGRTPLDITYDIVFFRIAGIFLEESTDDGIRHKEIRPKLRAVPGLPFAEYELEQGSLYRVKIATHHHHSLGPAQLPGGGKARLVLSVDERLFDTPGSTDLRVASAYDLHYWPLVPTASGRQCVIRIQCVVENPKAATSFVRKEVVSADISLPVRLLPEAE